MIGTLEKTMMQNSVVYNLPSGVTTFNNGLPVRTSSKGSVGSCLYEAVQRLFHKNVNQTEFQDNSGLSSLKVDLQEYSAILRDLQQELENLESELNKRLFIEDRKALLSEVDKAWADALIHCHQLSETERQNYLSQNGLPPILDEFFFLYFPLAELSKFKLSDRTSFYDFLIDQYWSNKKDIYIRFLNKTHGEVESFRSLLSGQPSQTLVSDLQHLAQVLTITQYGFKRFNWTKDENIETFLIQLKESGPIIVPGKFGEGYVEQAPEKLKESHFGRSVFVWKKGTRLEISRSHIVTIIGGTTVGSSIKHGGGFVYFIDPNESSVPEHPELDKIYKISYRQFCTYIENFPNLQGEVVNAIYSSGILPKYSGNFN